MSRNGASTDSSTDTPEVGVIDMRLEVVTLPVSDVDRAKSFYQSLGWRLDADLAVGDDFRVVQFTPTHSQSSIHFGNGLTSAEPKTRPHPTAAGHHALRWNADMVPRRA